MVKILEPILTPTLKPTARMAQQAEVGLHVNEMLTRRSACRALTALWRKVLPQVPELERFGVF